MNSGTTRSRRVRLAHLAALVLLPALLALPGTASYGIAGNQGKQQDGLVPIEIGTYNIRADRTLKQFRKGVDALKERVHVAGLQEVAQREKNDYLEADENWGYYRPAELRQNPIIWDTDHFEYLGSPDTGHRIAHGREIEAKEGGTEFKDSSFATVVRLEHLVSGAEVSVINVHLLSGASRVGLPWPGRPRRFEMLCDQVRGLMRLVRHEKELGNTVFVVGDFNVGFQADQKVQDKRLPFKRFKRIGFRSIWQGGELSRKGTYENAYLDQVFADEAATWRQVARDIKQSDHFPALGGYLLDVEVGLP